MSGRRAQASRNASLLGLSGSLLMILQSAFMLVGGAVALYALSFAVRGDLTTALEVAGTAAVLVGITLLFDLVGLTFLSTAFWLHAKTARVGPAFAPAPDPERRSLAFQGLLAAVFLLLWLLVTLAWRGALAAIVSFYPSPFGTDLGGIASDDLRRAAGVMLGLWVVAAFLLFLGAVFGTRFLQRARGVPVSFWRLLWPAETLLHFGTAVAILAVAPGLLARRLQVEIGTLRVIETLGVLDLLVVPILGLLAYGFLFREFWALFRRAPAPGASPPAPAPSPTDPPGGGT